MNATVRLTSQEPAGKRGARFTFEFAFPDLPLLTLVVEADPDRPSTYAAEFLPREAWDAIDEDDRHMLADAVLIETLRRHAATRPGPVH